MEVCDAKKTVIVATKISFLNRDKKFDKENMKVRVWFIKTLGLDLTEKYKQIILYEINFNNLCFWIEINQIIFYPLET